MTRKKHEYNLLRFHVRCQLMVLIFLDNLVL